MPNTALNRTVALLLTNKSGGALTYGAVVIIDTANASAFTTTTTTGYSATQVGVVLEPNGIANNALGMIAIAGYVPIINLNAAATIGQLIKTHTVAGQGTPHASPQVEGDFAEALTASATPEAFLFGTNGPGGSGGITQLTGDVTAGPGSGSQAATIANNAVTTVKILDANVTKAKIENVAADRLLGRGNGGGAGAPQEISLGTNLSMSGTTLNASGGSGAIIQVVNTQTGAVATGTTTTPMDDTIPQNTEGTEFMTLAITPTSATNKLIIDVVLVLAANQASIWLIMALFQDTTANALAATVAWMVTANAVPAPMVLRHYMTSGTTSATTFKVRAGGSGASTVTVNGSNGSRFMGGVMASSITITEVTP